MLLSNIWPNDWLVQRRFLIWWSFGLFFFSRNFSWFNWRLIESISTFWVEGLGCKNINKSFNHKNLMSTNKVKGLLKGLRYISQIFGKFHLSFLFLFSHRNWNGNFFFFGFMHVMNFFLLNISMFPPFMCVCVYKKGERNWRKLIEEEHNFI